MGDGIDVILTEDSSGPVVLVHKGWQLRQQSGSKQGEGTPTRRFADSPNPPNKVYSTKDFADRSRDVKERSQAFEFVNATASSRDRGSNTRKLVRVHAMKYVQRKKRHQRDEDRESQEVLKVKSQQDNIADSEAQFKIMTLSQKVVALCAISKGPELFYYSHPVILNPHMDNLIIHYLTTIAEAMYPLESLLSLNPLKTEWWLQFAMSDNALFHAVLYGSMVAVGLIEGVRESSRAVVRLNQVIFVINKRLNQPIISDATICAVSCLALAEAVRGNLESWRVHMNGLKMIVETRGGLRQLSTVLQMKLLRSDLIGAVDFVVAPNFKFQRSGLPSTHSTLQLQGFNYSHSGFVEEIRASGVHQQLVLILQELDHFSQAIQYAMTQQPPVVLDPTAFVEDMFSIQHGLLLYPDSEYYNQDTYIDEACRIAGLLYLKEVLRDFRFSIVGQRKLGQKLRAALLQVPTSNTTLPLMIWMLFIGAISSKGTSNRTWFVARLLHVTKGSSLRTWKEVEEVLASTLWITVIHSPEGEKLFTEATIMREVLIEGNNTSSSNNFETLNV